MTIVLREMTRDAADAILAGERPGGVRVADDYPTEFSAGVAQWDGAETSDAVLQRADAALYAAKETGRNRIATAPDGPSSRVHMRSSA